MKYIVATLSAVMLAGSPAIAQDASTSDVNTPAAGVNEAVNNWGELIRTRDITGGAVYTTNEAYDEGSWNVSDDDAWGESGYDALGSDWNEIGEIEDVILDQSGQFVGIVAEVGGFLDIGDKHVLLRVADVDLIPVDDQSYIFVTRYSEEELESMPGVDEGWWN
ncbi:PRC-barrel domain-containing protein [Fulvimarina sp. 2208YS6-2-32]|uniref:PRC-barrel domain-containing protein n=1 Tax=Fulvimarina uroteuthidis TaxID=3098149 RepID=A0ABU5I414_9HYPH|nr:PRC-barrel domain-containing protein [Fulvimarina sp. 2208YS6-2-32]MDY8110132.1 PRC-barrel domain-containing protein [Fulvimarina sp. 2208YS6-2-32]